MGAALVASSDPAPALAALDAFTSTFISGTVSVVLLYEAGRRQKWVSKSPNSTFSAAYVEVVSSPWSQHTSEGFAEVEGHSASSVG